MRVLTFTACVLTVSLFVRPAPAWELVLTDDAALPPTLIAVDKGNDTLFYLEKRSPLSIQQAFPSIHGQAEGDKLEQGDMRTPEGVYFVTGKVRGPLDFEEYGSQAYPLNYPNPVDKLRGKTGGGIWIHSKGRPIATQTTRGCIAVDLADIDALAPHLLPGTAVVVAENIISDAIQPTLEVQADVAAAAPATGAVTRLLTERTEAWNQAWASRSASMFDFYDSDAYTLAQGEPFSAFRAQKEQLFQRLPWIQIQYGEISVLQGPGYWVSWFRQYYRAPNLTTEGVRRLYWQPGKNGELKIVGMEWLPQDLGMERAYLDGLAPSVVAFVEEWRQAWERGDLEAYISFYAKDAIQDRQRGLDAIIARKNRTWTDQKKPLEIQFSGLRVRLEDRGVRVDMTQVYRDTAGYQDKGTKEMLLYPEGNSWRIASEMWTAS